MYIEDLLEKLNKVHEDFWNVKVIAEIDLRECWVPVHSTVVEDWDNFDVDSIRSPWDYSDNSKKKTDTVILYISK